MLSYLQVLLHEIIVRQSNIAACLLSITVRVHYSNLLSSKLLVKNTALKFRRLTDNVFLVKH